MVVLLVTGSGREGPCDTRRYQTGERNRINLTEDPIAGVDDSTHLEMITAKITAVEELSRKAEGLHLGTAGDASQVLVQSRVVVVVVVVVVVARRG